MENRKRNILFSEEQIQEKVKELGAQITKDYQGKEIYILGAKSVKTCTLLDKPSRRKVDLSPDYCCFEIDDLFVVGYGLDYNGYYRNVPYVFNWEQK